MVLHRREQDPQYLYGDVLSRTGPARSQLAALRGKLAFACRRCSSSRDGSPLAGTRGISCKQSLDFASISCCKPEHSLEKLRIPSGGSNINERSSVRVVCVACAGLRNSTTTSASRDGIYRRNRRS